MEKTCGRNRDIKTRLWRNPRSVMGPHLEGLAFRGLLLCLAALGHPQQWTSDGPQRTALTKPGPHTIKAIQGSLKVGSNN